MSLKVGVWGVGFMGSGHARILRRDPRVELVAVYDADRARADQVAAEVGCRAVGSAPELLDAVEAVYIVVPNTLHAGAARQALAAGKHVFCEKPFTVTLDDARDIRDRAAQSGRVFMVGHNRRFAPVYERARQLLGEESFEPTSARFKMNRGELERPAWTGDPAVTGGYLFETPLHLFDLARWMFGEVADIHVMGQRRVYQEVDNFSLLFEFESSLSLAFTSCAHASWHFPFERIEVFGRHATLETEEMERLRWTRGVTQPPETRTEDYEALPSEEKWGYVALDRHFVSAALGEEEPLVTAEDGFRAVEIVDRIYSRLRG